MKISKLFIDFFKSERTGGLILIIATIASLIISNSFYSTTYISFWHKQILNESIEFWINDGLMTIFFFLIGLELVREMSIGELSHWRNALLPAWAAVGGMVVPALIYYGLNKGLSTVHGAGIPMATDIAFTLGVLSLLGNKVPFSLKIFLTALAIIDDIGAILCIAIFYSKGIDFNMLGLSLFVFVILIVINKLKVRNLVPYLIGGILMWYFMLYSGVHATISGVLLALTIPFGKGTKKRPSYLIQKYLHMPVPYIILPLFALCNTAIIIPENWYQNLTESYSLGIILGLVISKPLGILTFLFLMVVLFKIKLPKNLNWINLTGGSCLAGIGFTMSIFISLLAFDDVTHINNSKISILISSLIAALIGWLVLFLYSPSKINRLIPKQPL